ncbi:MAG: endonuclease [Candidatus Omnitrophica bacterium CG11_big_fil_rev_8_21_14_0_20_45_26]|uniref:Endonuclease n=1 Tax=Candidatus Abzuiibacterium crystallinum TaxID=1974748 RepID=A0A2H0LKR6_9BACT|nr:MAG: endonuclease [Candidatus Omnitrophica bacterium CG11_big_fil_rev_8_21_14_0_20_45_26]PIW63940.1 MAG: endonuclease [Candidatus Omnitrophica bacterium CG12_big_fil_rev_8_21_14_0_65_45_16]
MFNVYVLKSLKSRKRYIGFTSKSPDKRLSEHNEGTSQWTKQHKPLQLLHLESFDSKKEALKREQFLKSGQGRKWLDENVDIA